ncbi:uncharacterized protein LOC143283535 [Babylonia areolata]|uniref:uncharacterized protein LOC143283535 n=1 Tax=Babylonia areolata TaxID=304850 RepID=UPI003FD14F11
MVPLPFRTQKPAAGSSSSVTVLVMMVVVMVVGWGVAVAVPVPPTMRIVVRVRKRRTTNWEPWQINSNVCPPSLCRSSSESSSVPAPRPRGTGGSVFYQGDIVLDKAVDRYIFPEVNHTRFRRATIRMRDKQWKDGVVPYVISGSVSAQSRRVILRAFKHISQRTCITFRKKKESDEDFVKFIGEPGCWSAIGRSGGQQLLSLGRGCENVGTAVHEVTHALGVWHEQARKDRDQYVRILEDNVSERFLKDFEKIKGRLSTSRGFPYDYTSVMHYSKFAFTRNGKPTIEVIGVGKKLGLTVKQRGGLSTIDMAQLRDMYHCNLHTDTADTRCPKGWHHHGRDCYRFYEHPKVQFAAAMKRCRKQKAHLAWIESKREDQFLARYLHRNFPYVYTWRIGARRINDAMTWYLGKDSKPVAITYNNWAEGHPSSYSSGVLQRNHSSNVTRWEGVWAGSMAQLPYFVYPFICERRAKRPCLPLRHKDGRDYRGKLDHTIDGITCQKWTDQYPHAHNLSVPADDPPKEGQEDPEGLGDHNYCRNPSAQRRSRPWCFTTKSSHRWQLCDVTSCGKKKEKEKKSSGESSRGSPSSVGEGSQQPTQQSSSSNSSLRGRRHSGVVERPPSDAGSQGAAAGASGDSTPSRRKRQRRRKGGKGRGKGKGKGRGRGRKRGARKGRKLREGSKRRRRGRRQGKRQGQGPQEE